MLSICARFCAMTALLSMSGCFIGTPALDRTLEIRQLQTTDNYSGEFRIDASQLPPDAVESRVEHGRSGPKSFLTVKQGYPVKVLLVPATQP
jgi:hypothetical protein